MKPVSYQSMPSSVNSGHPSLALDCVLGSKVMYCEKCGFASMDAAVFTKHVQEHLGTRLYCFYCKHTFFSEAELNAHMKQHTSKYRFICPHCGQGYMRRLCLVKHIDRLHSKGNSQAPAKPGMMKNLQVPVSSALTSAPPADPTPPRPLVRVTVPTPSTPAVRLGKDEQRAKTLERNLSTATNGNAERLPPFSGLIQQNRALTVSLPEEVTIPAGCLVELVEVKTVNGTKELKLRVVSQQKNESVIKETRTAVSQNTTLEKPLSSTLNNPNTSSSLSMGMCTVKRKQPETKTVAVERPPAVSVHIPNNFPSPVSVEKCRLKRTSQEVINLESDTVVPSKSPKSILNNVREGNAGIRGPAAPGNHKAAPPNVTLSRIVNRLNTVLHPDSTATSVSQRAVEERKNILSELLKTIPHRRANDTINIQNVSGGVKVQPVASHLKGNTASKTVRDSVLLNPHSSKSASPPVSAPRVEVRCPPILAGQNNLESFPIPKTLSNPSSIRTSVVSNHTASEILSWPQKARSKETPSVACLSEPESFPVISSVFSLSQQPEHVHGPIKPLVLALRGIVMDKNNNSSSSAQDDTKVSHVPEPVKKAPTSGQGCAQVETKEESSTPNLLQTEQTNETVKEEKLDMGIQLPPPVIKQQISVKEEKNNPQKKTSHTNDSKSSTKEETVSNVALHTEGTQTATNLHLEVLKTEKDVSSKFLTVSLKRVQVGVWKKCKKRLKLRISSYKSGVPMSNLGDCRVLHPMPLKMDQLVKRPGPNQPVVVLNHPKPRVSIQGSRADTLTDAGAAEVVPECQILKMRLSKVMGQKYEVMGYTVRDFP